jgi:hypothetical protein
VCLDYPHLNSSLRTALLETTHCQVSDLGKALERQLKTCVAQANAKYNNRVFLKCSRGRRGSIYFHFPGGKEELATEVPLASFTWETKAHLYFRWVWSSAARSVDAAAVTVRSSWPHPRGDWQSVDNWSLNGARSL